jgi:hypothetical protein
VQVPSIRWISKLDSFSVAALLCSVRCVFRPRSEFGNVLDKIVQQRLGCSGAWSLASLMMMMMAFTETCWNVYYVRVIVHRKKFFCDKTNQMH